MLPSDVVRNIASFLPATHAQVVEPVWRPHLDRAFYDALHERDGHRRTMYGSRSGIEYHLHTRLVEGQYVTTMTRNGLATDCVCYHGINRGTAKDASDWLLQVMYSGHRRGPRIDLRGPPLPTT